MPAYNAEEYISEAIESILAQTFKEWELVITDDCSTDNTVEIVEGFCKGHKNIRLIKRSTNSGAARLPRKESAFASTGEFIMTYDADDFLDYDYIEKMYNRQQETGADIILSTLHLCNRKGEMNGFCIPKVSFPLECIISGKEATKHLLGEVEISVSGLLIKREIYLENISTGKNEENNYSYVDEIDQRRLLFSCKNVAFANTKYYYRQHSESLMHQKNIKRYNILQTSKSIYEFAKRNYTEEQLAFIYLIDPLGVAEYIKTYDIHHKNKLPSSIFERDYQVLYMKDNVYELIFNEKPKYYREIDNELVEVGFYNAITPQGRLDVYSSAEVLFGEHIINNNSWQKVVNEIIIGIFTTLPVISQTMSIIELAKVTFFGRAVSGVMEEGTQGFIDEYIQGFKPTVNQPELTGFAKFKNTLIGWVPNLANIIIDLGFSLLDGLVPPNMSDIAIYKNVSNNTRFIPIFEGINKELSLSEVAELFE